MDWTEKMVSGNDLINIRNQRSKTHIFSAIKPQLLDGHLQLGWEIDKELKTKVRIKKAKPADEAFEDRVWMLFARMGFTDMNRDRHLEIPYEKNNPALTQQIDVLAIDDETAIVVECKSAQTQDKKTNFKETITAMQGTRAGIMAAVKKKYPKRRFAFIFATHNYVLGDQDLDRLREAKITYFDEDVLVYYEELVRQLGRCAKYQLQGHLFMNQKIDNMQALVPAVQGSMGGHTYYAFSIKPATLLKMCHVLHRSKVNKDNMPSYQRFVKRDRLIAVRNFIDNGGYFPNSIVINIEVAKKIHFDYSEKQCEESMTKLGLLHLPQVYHSAYVIDGQHRLYGYAETEYAETNTIPVVAFVGLKAEEQVELFMQINENQKAVPKKLRNVLNASLLQDSDDPNQRRKALRLSIAQKLGEDPASPLYRKVSIDETDNNPEASITMEAISDGIKKVNYLNTYKKKNGMDMPVEIGLFDLNDNDMTRAILYPYLKDCFAYIHEQASKEWDMGKSGVILINNGVQAIIMLLHDITNHVKNAHAVNPLTTKSYAMLEHVKKYLDALIAYVGEMTPEEREAVKRYGSTGPIRAWRIYQKAVRDRCPEFQPEGLDEWWKDNGKQHNEEAVQLLDAIYRIIKADIPKHMTAKFGSEWFALRSPEQVYLSASNKAIKENLVLREEGKTVTAWDCVTLAQCRQIILHKNNWQDTFSSVYAYPNMKGDKNKKTEWMDVIDKLRSKDLSTYSVTEAEYEMLQTVYKWLSKE